MIRRFVRSTFALVFACAAALLPLACASPHPTNLIEPAAPPVRPTASAPVTAPNSQAKDAEKAAKEAEERAVKRRKLDRDLAIARRKLDQARMGMEQATWNNERAIAKAAKDLELSRRKFQQFQEHSSPTRVAQAELSLRGAEDGFKEAQEELAQLDMMYKDDQFADKTKEIVLERGRRRLERSQKDLDIRRRELAALKDKSLPIEMDEQTLGVAEKERELEKLHHEEQSTKLDKQIGILSAESEIARLEDELAALEKEIAAAKEKHDKSESK